MISSTTQRLAEFALTTRFEDLPVDVQGEGLRSFVNWMGCTIGGSRHPAASTLLDVTREFSGPATATLLGIGREMDALNTACINCLASAAHAFDDTHLATVIHPTGPIASALFALAERGPDPMSGKDLQTALVIGIEVACHLGVGLLLPPAKGQLGWYMTGVAGALGSAAASARALGLSHEQTCWALGLAGNQASGFRQTHGSMCTSFVPGHAARSGLQAALLAQAGMTATMACVEGENGYAQVFSHSANISAIDEGLGNRWEIRSNAYKPYPSGIVIHPVTDACLNLQARDGFSAHAIESVRIEVNPLCLTLCDRPEPKSDQDGQVSVQHWTAVSLLIGKAGIAEGSHESVNDSRVVALRKKVTAEPADDVARDGARVHIQFDNGQTWSESIAHARGSLANPLSDAELDAKFLAQAGMVLDEARADVLLARCRQLTALDDVAGLAAMTLR